MSNLPIQTLKGFRDFLPKTMAIRNRVISTLKKVFDSYGFSEIQTPTLEYATVLKGKYGEEAEKLMYLFTDHGGREVGLNYDLTVPLARVIAEHGDIPLPFKRYQIQPAFRAENTQRSRYREFYQCDIDTVGTTSPLADAEILAIISDSLSALKFNQFVIRVNSRVSLAAITDSPSILQTIDKLDKKSEVEVKSELLSKGLSASEADAIFTKLDALKPDEHLEKVIDRAKQLGAQNLQFDPRLVRGLDYYTGAIFETKVLSPDIGSITGGGRYDHLIKNLGGPDLPAVGSTLGLDRLCDVIEALDLWPDIQLASIKTLVTVFNTDLINLSITGVMKLRESGIPTELYPESRNKLSQQFKYANQKGIPFVIVIGPDEAAKNVVTLKNMQTGEQKTDSLDKLIPLLLEHVQ